MIGRDEGFSLLECIIALAILAGSVATLLPMMAASGERDARATARLRAAFTAEAILNRVGLDVPLVIGHLRGRLPDGSAWTIDIRDYVEAETKLEGRGGRLLQIDIAVTPRRWRSDNVALATLKRATDR